MAVKSTFPNAKQPITDASGFITKAHFDFLRSLWLRTGGNNDNINDLEQEASAAELLVFRNRIKDLEKRISNLEKEITALGC